MHLWHSYCRKTSYQPRLSGLWLRCPNLAFLSLGDDLPKALKYLSLHGFSKLESIAERLENTSLEEISIWSRENLKMLPEDLHKLQNLQRFSLGFCNNVVSFPRGGLPSTKLTKVDINGCQRPEALPNGIHNLTSLQRLKLGYLPSVVSFPEDGFPTTILSRRCRTILAPDNSYTLCRINCKWVFDCQTEDELCNLKNSQDFLFLLLCKLTD